MILPSAAAWDVKILVIDCRSCGADVSAAGEASLSDPNLLYLERLTRVRLARWLDHGPLPGRQSVVDLIEATTAAKA